MMYDYWYWEDFYSSAEIKQLHHVFHKTKHNQSEDKPAENTKKNLNLTISRWKNFKDKLTSLEQSILITNSEKFGYNIWPQYDNNDLLLNEYDSVVKGEYDWHFDGSNNHTYDIKYTILINVSLEPYKGGQFYLFSNGGPKHIKELDKPGNVVMFKSYLHHKVNPITSGKRHSISLFYKGPRFI